MKQRGIHSSSYINASPAKRPAAEAVKGLVSKLVIKSCPLHSCTGFTFSSSCSASVCPWVNLYMGGHSGDDAAEFKRTEQSRRTDQWTHAASCRCQK